MRLAKKTPPDVWMQLTSLIDVIFLLLIFFMCATELNRLDNENISLPLALNAKEDVGPELLDRITITIFENKNVTPSKWEMHVQKRIFDMKELERLIAERALRKGKDARGITELPVKIRGDSDCPYKYVQKVMEVCSRNGIWRISFGASPREGAKPARGFGSSITDTMKSAGSTPAPKPATGP
jgi:biopolymer transport protein ExbD